MQHLARAAQRLQADERGAVAMMVACSLGVVFAAAALAVDASRFYLLKRQQQSATDLAAIAASSNIGKATAAARASLAANGRSAADLVSVEVGTYVPDLAVASHLRFTSGAGAGPNAARVTLRTTNASFFGPVLSFLMPKANAAPVPNGGASPADSEGDTGTAIVTRSVAAMRDSASFALGSRLASLDGGFLNQVLGQLLGTQLSLSVMDYEALASANVDLFGLADALALRAAPKGATYGNLAATQVRLMDVLWAAADAVGTTSPAAAGALRTMSMGVGPSGPTFVFGNLVSYASFGNLAVGSPAPISASTPVLQLVTAAAKLGGSPRQVVAHLEVNLPGIASSDIRILIGAIPTESTYATIGPSGTTIHTAQTGLLLTLKLAGSAPLASVTLPLVVEVAPATARLASVSCLGGSVTGGSAVLGVRAGVVDAWIGTVSDADFMAGRALDPSPATLATAAFGAQITALAHATVSNSSESLVPFSTSEIGAGVAKTSTTVEYTSSLLSELFGSLQLGARTAGLSVTVPSELSNAVATTLRGRTQSVDALLSNTLALLGLSVGNADTWVRGVRCGQSVLVN